MHYTPEMTAAWQPTPEALLDVCDYAARITLRSRLLSREDFEDARQTAVLHCWDAAQRYAHKGRGYFYIVARYAIFDWLNQQRSSATECSYDGFEWLHAQPMPEEDIPPRLDVERLREYGEFTDDEISYLYYCVQGYNPTAIGHAMGTNADAAYRYRARLLPRLYHLAGQQPPPKRRRPLTDSQCRLAAQLRASGLAWSEIAQQLDCPIKQVTKAYYRTRAAL